MAWASGSPVMGRRFPQLRQTGSPAPRFLSQNVILTAGKRLVACFWRHKKPLREWRHANPNICWDWCSRNSILAAEKTLGLVFGNGKSPCGNEDTHSLGCPHKIGVFSYGKTLGRVFWGKKPLREWGHALPRFSSQIRCF